MKIYVQHYKYKFFLWNGIHPTPYTYIYICLCLQTKIGREKEFEYALQGFRGHSANISEEAIEIKVIYVIKLNMITTKLF